MNTSRREFLRQAGAVSLGFCGLHTLFGETGVPATRAADLPGCGPLRPDPARILDLPPGFAYRILSRTGDTMDDGFVVPGEPDGMATFAGPRGTTLLVRNHELLPDRTDVGPFGPDNRLLSRLAPEYLYDRRGSTAPCLGGTTTLFFDTINQRLMRQYLSLAGTEHNCAGGPTPWNTWISCEETEQRAESPYERHHGYAFEVPAQAYGKPVIPQPLVAMGRFRREAIAVDPRSGIIYQTEDIDDGLFYRFIPERPGELLAGGRLQALCARAAPGLDTRNWIVNGAPTGRRIRVGQRFDVSWIDMRDIHALNNDLRYQGFARGAARFARAEGIWAGRDTLFFACTTGGAICRGQIWKYHPSPVEGTAAEADQPGVLELFIESRDPGLLDNADNLTVSPWGDLVVCEDGLGEQYLVGITPAGAVYKLARNAQDGSEFAGATFSPDGTTLFVNLQQSGLTLAITGPWPSAPRSRTS